VGAIWYSKETVDMAEVTQNPAEVTQKKTFVEIEVDPSLSKGTMTGRQGTVAEGFGLKKAYKIEAHSDRENNKIFISQQSGFVHAVYESFNKHIPLCFSPDHLWTLIIQGVSTHIEVNAEELRSKFVDFDGKKVLRIFRDNFVKDSPDNDWAGCFNEWSAMITKWIGQDNRKKLVPTFSTTGTLETALHDLALMDCMKNYFSYRCSTFCGIPKVKLEGTIEDWKNLRSMVEGLNEYDLSWWTQHLLPIIDKIIKTYEGEQDKIFWYTIYKQWSTAGSGASTYVNGWITTFFPYINKRRRNSFPNLDELRKDAMPKETTTDNSDPMMMYMRHPRLVGTIEIYDVPNNVSTTPFIWEYLGAEIPMTIYGGFCGCEMDGEYVRPKLAWAVGPKKPEEEKKKQNWW